MRWRHHAGFTLVEVSIAIAIITIALVPATIMRLKAAQANVAIEEREKFAILVQRLLETRVRAVPFAALTSVSGVNDPDTNLKYDIAFSQYATPSPSINKVTITVYPSNSAIPIDRLVTLVAKEATP
ncbi:prepilin-type N-terminal cleavage/methylation domain-containing protein [bacterium]|nr:prepilin-type N-terminal cleavage/methylation domain-containing protein [bacterium]